MTSSLVVADLKAFGPTIYSPSVISKPGLDRLGRRNHFLVLIYNYLMIERIKELSKTLRHASITKEKFHTGSPGAPLSSL